MPRLGTALRSSASFASSAVLVQLATDHRPLTTVCPALVYFVMEGLDHHPRFRHTLCMRFSAIYAYYYYPDTGVWRRLR